MPVCEVDLRPGGTWHFVWRRADGSEMEMTGTYREIVPPERVVKTESWGEDWPETVVTLTLTEEDGRTTNAREMSVSASVWVLLAAVTLSEVGLACHAAVRVPT
jgi:uncharacterized protein YndB with AHSA1/START domain